MRGVWTLDDIVVCLGWMMGGLYLYTPSTDVQMDMQAEQIRAFCRSSAMAQREYGLPSQKPEIIYSFFSTMPEELRDLRMVCHSGSSKFCAAKDSLCLHYSCHDPQ